MKKKLKLKIERRAYKHCGQQYMRFRISGPALQMDHWCRADEVCKKLNEITLEWLNTVALPGFKGRT